MTDLPGNPHVDEIQDAVVFSADGSPMQTTEFLLENLNRSIHALAFEQRTANLVALHATFPTGPLDKEIRRRLGMSQRSES